MNRPIATSRGRRIPEPSHMRRSIGGRRPRRWQVVGLVALVVVVLLGVLAGIKLSKSVPALGFHPGLPAAYRIAGHGVVIPWPSGAASALDVAGVGSFGHAGATTPSPMASLTKLMTAWIVLRDHPLAPPGPGVGDGPVVTFGPLDVALWSSEVAMGDSVLQVANGETLSERQMLEALLLPSADNIAEKLAVWDAGSVGAFVTRMNQAASAMGLASTHYADAAGLDPNSASTPTDIVSLAETDMANPAFAAIVATRSVLFPVAGLVPNLTPFLGQDGIVGIKTGFTPQAGGCAVLAAKVNVGGQLVMVYATVIGQHPGGFYRAGQMARALILTAQKAMSRVGIIVAHRSVGTITSRWGQSTSVEAAAAVNEVVWPGLAVRLDYRLDSLGHSIPAAQAVGAIEVTVGSQHDKVPLVTGRGLPGPSLAFRLLHN